MSLRPSDIEFVKAWNDKSAHSDVLTFWDQQKIAISDPQKRLSEIVYVAYHGDKVIGVTTTERRVSKLINNRPIYSFRFSIDPTYRIPGLSDKLFILTRDLLEGHFHSGQSDCIGLITFIENKQVQNQMRKADPVYTKLLFIGTTKSGHHIRIYYFKGAKI